MIPYVVHDASGVILKSGECGEATTIALQADTGAGEVALIVEGGDGGFIDDANVEIVDGAFSAKSGYLGPLPTATQLTLPE